MTKKYEASWRDKYEYYERVFDINSNSSVCNKITLPQEWYEENSRGDYESILDTNRKLVRKQGQSKTAREEWGYIDPLYRNIRDNYWHEEIQNSYNTDCKVLYLDIETRVGQNSVGFPVPEKALEEITLMQIYDNKLDTLIVIGSREWKHQNNYKFDYKVQYVKVNNEIELLDTFIKIFQKLNPLIIYAWNGNGFDFPYIYNRMKNLGLDTNKLSVYGSVTLKEKVYGHKTIYEIQSDGHYFLDLLEVYKNFTFGTQPSYSLDFISELELGKKKVDHSEYEKFDDFYSGNYKIPLNPTNEQKESLIYKEAINGNWDEVKELAYSDFVYYGCKDTYLILEIDKVKNFTALLFMISEKMGVQINDAMSTVKPWSQYISNTSHLKKQVLPKLSVKEDNISIKGGYVASPIVGKHKWVMSADVNSMYPLLGMVGFNMSPETFIPKHKLPNDLKEIILRYFNDENEEARFEIPKDIWNKTTELLQKYNYSLGINGAIFDKSKLGMIPKIIQDIYASRKAAKKTMFDYEKRALLIKEILKSK